jgi:hypothetical protein
VMALLCLGGIGVTFVLYDDATKIDRSTPDQVVSSYLRAYLVNKDDSAASLLQCKSPGDLSALSAFRDDIESREMRYSIGIRVTWGTLTVTGAGNNTTVTTNLTRVIADGSERTSDSWQFKVVDEDGWRVCGASAAA